MNDNAKDLIELKNNLNNMRNIIVSKVDQYETELEQHKTYIEEMIDFAHKMEMQNKLSTALNTLNKVKEKKEKQKEFL